jgi:hypothetical protein
MVFKEVDNVSTAGLRSAAGGSIEIEEHLAAIERIKS